MAKITLSDFISAESKRRNMSTSDYMEQVAKKNYVIVKTKTNEADAWDDGSLIVFNNISAAIEESAGTMDRVMTEYSYYKLKKVI